MLEALKYADHPTALVRDHLAKMMQAIRDLLANPSHGHGGFVTAMAEQDYRQGFIRADGTNRRYFGVLMYYREIIIPNNPQEVE